MQNSETKPCPNCGHCPTCGRGGYHTYPYPYTAPYYPYPAYPGRYTWNGTQWDTNSTTATGQWNPADYVAGIDKF